MNKLRHLYLVLAGCLVLTLSLSLTWSAKSYALFEGAKNQACAGVNLNSAVTTCSSAGASSLTDKITTALNILSVIIGIIAVIMIMLGGLKFITAGGDPSSVASARTSIIYAIVGLIVVAMAQAVVLFVLDKLKK